MGNKVSAAETGEKKEGQPGEQPKAASKYGEPAAYDPTFTGPIQNRGCTDVLCCILFFICLLGMLGVGIVGYINGDPTILLYPTDSDGNLCGYGKYSNQSVLFFFDLLDCAKLGPAVLANGCPTPQVCLNACPSEYWSWYAQEAAESAAATGGATAVSIVQAKRSKMICKYAVNPLTTTKTLSALIADFDCAPYYVPSSALYGRCLPSFLTTAINVSANVIATVANSNVSETARDRNNKSISFSDLKDSSFWMTEMLNARDWATKVLSDVMASKWYIVAALGIIMVFTLFWITLMRWIVGFIVWLLIFAFLGVFSYATYFCFTKYYSMKGTSSDNSTFIVTTNLAYYLNMTQTWLAFSCGSATLLSILGLVILFLRERIQIAVAIMKEGSRAIGTMLFSLLWPIWPFILQLALFAYWVAAALFLASMTKANSFGTNVTALANLSAMPTSALGNSSYLTSLSATSCSSSNTSVTGQICSYVKVVVSYGIYLQIFNLFMLFWVMNFIVAFGQMVLAGAFASYYWAFDKKNMPTFPILSSMRRTLVYHTGSLAFGSLIIAIIQMIRVALEYLDHKLKGSENRIAKFFLKCLKCCFWCLEKVMKMINKNAYILIAVYGKNFCTSAKNAFMLIMRNIIRVAVVDKVSEFVLFLGKMVVVGGITVGAFYFFDGRIPFLAQYSNSLKLNYYLVPVIIIAVSAFVIASCFFSVYGMAVDTLFLCFLEDLERNDGSPEKPYYMSKELMKILRKKNKKPKTEEESS